MRYFDTYFWYFTQDNGAGVTEMSCSANAHRHGNMLPLQSSVWKRVRGVSWTLCGKDFSLRTLTLFLLAWCWHYLASRGSVSNCKGSSLCYDYALAISVWTLKLNFRGIFSPWCPIFFMLLCWILHERDNMPNALKWQFLSVWKAQSLRPIFPLPVRAAVSVSPFSHVALPGKKKCTVISV